MNWIRKIIKVGEKIKRVIKSPSQGTNLSEKDKILPLLKQYCESSDA